MVNVQVVLLSIIVFLIGFIIFLGITILQPQPIQREPTFQDIIEASNKNIEALSAVSLTYDINLSLNGSMITGSMIFVRNKTNTEVTLSPELQAYNGYGILLSPEVMIRFIQENNREEYAGVMPYGEDTCVSTITAPNSTAAYSKFSNGDYLFVTCFDKKIGYPDIAYNGEVQDDSVFYTQYVLKNASYS